LGNEIGILERFVERFPKCRRISYGTVGDDLDFENCGEESFGRIKAAMLESVEKEIADKAREMVACLRDVLRDSEEGEK
jgi:hypothetical protein